MLERLYMTLPAPVQNLAVTGLGLKHRIQRYGPAFRDHVEFLSRSQWWSEDQLRAWQERELFKLLRHAFGTVDHFKTIAPDRAFGQHESWEVLDSLPMLEKGEMRQDPERFTSHAIPAKDTIAVATSGTTGSPMTFLIDRQSRQMHYAYFDRLLRWSGVERSGWHAVFMGKILGTESQMARKPWRIDYSNRRVYYSSYHVRTQTVNAYAEHLVRCQFEWWEGYPSAIGNLIRLALEQGITLPPPKAVIPSSEILHDHTREVITTAVGDIIWEFYTAAEQAAFISQCEFGTLHINPEYGVVELDPRGMDENGDELFELVATSFRNRAMPLVRYRTDDLVTMSTEQCGCGRAFPGVGRIVGRDYSSVVLPDGRRVTGVGQVPKGLPVRKSQLVQLERDVLEFRVVPDPEGWNDEAEAKVQERLRARLGTSVRIRVRLVDGIASGPNGKTPLVVGLPSTGPRGQRQERTKG